MDGMKDCPQCGSSDVTDTHGFKYFRKSGGECLTCGLYMVDWNARPIEDALLARAVEAERKLAVAVEALKDIGEEVKSNWNDGCGCCSDMDPEDTDAAKAVLAALREIGGE